MLLRASAEHDNTNDDIAALKGGTGGGVEHGELSVRFVDSAMGLNKETLAAVRKEIREIHGELALFDIAATIATFEATDRTADATGTPVEDYREAAPLNYGVKLGFIRGGDEPIIVET